MARSIALIVGLFVTAALVLAPEVWALETISGNVVAAVGGLPLAGVDLDVFDSATGSTVAITGDVTDASGNYTVTLPGPGSYIIRTDPTAAQGVVSQYYNGVFLKSQAQALVVNTGSAISGINFSLSPGANISGTVTSGGAAVDAIDIDVFASNGEFLGAYNASTAADGTYTVGALPPGSYFVRADPDILLATQLFARSYYAASLDLAGATPVVVGTTAVSGIDMALTPGGTIKGIVTDASTGLPLVGIDLDLFDLTGKRLEPGAKTGLAGEYEVGAMPSGNYVLRVDPSVAQGYARTYYLASISESAASPISVTAGARTTNIDFAVPLGGTLSGTIRESGTGTPLAGIDLDLFDAVGSFLATYTATSDLAGNYQLGPMTPGSYFVRADPTALQGYATQFWAGAADLAFATAVTVSAGADTPGIDFNLPAGGTITGTIRNTTAAPLAGIDLDIFDAVTLARLRKGAMSAADGTYLFDTLAPGGYLVRADPTAGQGLARQYFNAQPSKAVADVIVSTSGATTSGIDFALDVAGTIAGQVFDANGVPVAGMDMDLFSGQGLSAVPMDQAAVTDAGGNFLFGALPAGTYTLRAQPDPTVSLPVYHPSTTDPAAATLIPVAAGQNVVGKNVTLTVVLSAVQNSDQQACLNAMHKDLSKVDKTQAKEILRCFKNRARGKLVGTLENCVTADSKGKINKAVGRTSSDFAKRCSVALPTFGATTAQAISDGGKQEALDAAHRLFGNNFDASIVVAGDGSSRSVSSCQLSVSKQAVKCSVTRLKGFARCLKDGLKTSSIVSTGTLSACLDQDPGGRIAKLCDPVSGKLAKTVASRCSLPAAELASALPGCASVTSPTADCVDSTLACTVCTSLNSADGLGRDCDLYDDGASNGSCP